MSSAGLVLALASSGTFALSGMFAASLFEAGWSAGAVTTLRVSLAAAVLLVPALVALRGRWHILRAARWQLLSFGVFAVVLAQLGYFMAAQFIPPALALLIEYLGPVLLVLWTWARSRIAPAALTLVGVAVAVLGLALVSGVGGAALHPLGILFGLVGAVGNAVYWASAASGTHGLPPVTLAGLGLGVGALILTVVAASGLVPFAIGGDAATLAGVDVPAWLVVAGVVLIATVAAYVLGIAGVRRLGATVASFAGYTETLFAIAWMALLLGILPTGSQWLGATAIIAGVVLVKVGEVRAAHRGPTPDEPPLTVPELPVTDAGRAPDQPLSDQSLSDQSLSDQSLSDQS
ncbi:DMT family transporter [Microbacterium sp. NPDC096154]|uniref:EamA family transporter n=1 Tax=Microbacterium sp. NPDC096154 TaxID=3155549 RepID=UPI0033257BB9